MRQRRLVVLPLAALVAAGGLITAAPATTPAIASGAPPTAAGAVAAFEADQPWINTVAPKFKDDRDETVPATRDGVKKSALDLAWDHEKTYTGGNPMAERQLASIEQEATKTGKNPRQIKQAKATQTAKLLTILVEFNPDANDDFSGVQVPATVFGDRTCGTGGIQSGPLHNGIPNPADAPFPDNNTFWVPDFSSEHYDKLLYTSEGITDRVRPDLTGPDGQPGISIAGFTMRNHYLEMSKGAYTVSGAATPWVQVPHSEAWYGADRCAPDENGDIVAGPPQRMVGHPDNPAGPGQLAIDAAEALMEQNPGFPLGDYDIEDQFDRDGDGNVFEPDGYIDHVVLVHAGEDKSGGGGAQGPYAIWAHSSTVVNAEPIGDTGLRLANYIVQPEDSGVGVFSHEYGHDLGLPDLYDTSGAGDSHIEFWDLMSSGSHSGPVFQSMPTHMGLWDKWVLGWADPLILAPGASERDVQIGESALTPKGTRDGVRVSLPNKVITLATPHSGTSMWWSTNDQDWADVRLARTVDVPAAPAATRFWMWNDYTIEEDWDFGFVEVSTDGGATWAEQKVFSEDGTEVSTPDGYADPNGRMADFGGKKYGLTGDTGGWRHDYVDLSTFAGQSVQVRLRYATDEAFLERGWFTDDLSVTVDGTAVWTDDAEANNGWTPTVDTFTATTGEGWKLDTGTATAAHYYLAEWRNTNGFDQGLKYAYDSTYTPEPNTGGAWRVEKVQYNAPGLLVWYRDTSYGNDNHVTSSTFDAPSIGSKGGLLLVDSHFDPMRHTGAAAAVYDDGENGLGNFPVRMNTSDVAFTLWGTNPANDCFAVDNDPGQVFCTAYGNRGAVSSFSDAQGWYPGVEVNDAGLFFRDIDGSAVIPSRGNAYYSTRVVDSDGNPLPEFYGLDLGGGHVLGSGNPGDEGKQFGVSFTIVRAGQGNRFATVHVTAATP
jgi:immune inhibitor A